jgi:hypothetical protein
MATLPSSGSTLSLVLGTAVLVSRSRHSRPRRVIGDAEWKQGRASDGWEWKWKHHFLRRQQSVLSYVLRWLAIKGSNLLGARFPSDFLGRFPGMSTAYKQEMTDHTFPPKGVVYKCINRLHNCMLSTLVSQLTGTNTRINTEAETTKLVRPPSRNILTLPLLGRRSVPIRPTTRAVTAPPTTHHVEKLAEHAPT